MADPLIALPPGMVLDPFWDWAPGGIALPIWLMVLIVMVLFFLASNLWWLYKYLVMRPVLGHGEAARAGNEKTQQVLLFGLNRAFSIQALEYMEKVLSFKDPIRVARWLQTSPYSVGMLGYKSIMLITETFDHPKDPLAEMAICTAARLHNEGVESEAVEGYDPENPMESVKKYQANMITDYNSYRDNREMLEGENPFGVEIDIYSLYDPGMIYRYTPQNRTAGQFGGTILKDANDLNMATPVKSTWERAIPLFICVVFGIIAMAMCYMYVTSGGPAPAAAAPITSPIPGV